MRRARLELGDRYGAWTPAARRGLLRTPSGSRPVLVLLGPKEAREDALVVAREAATPWMGRSAAGVLPLEAIARSGERVVWVFAATEALAVAHLVGERPLRRVPAGAAVELVGQVARIALGAGAPLTRGVPTADDVLVGPAGEIWLAGLAGPARGPSPLPPGEAEGEGAVVYRLGVVLAGLFGAADPPGTPDAHAAWLRRVLLRAQERANTSESTHLTDHLRGMLAWHTGDRPPLVTLPEGLAHLAARLGGPDLAAWAGAQVGGALSSMQAPAARADEEDSAIGRVADLSDPGNLESASAMIEHRTTQSMPPGEVARARRPAMPVRFGPPPEGLRESATLPAGFFDGTPPDGVAPGPAEGAVVAPVAIPYGLIAAASVLALVAGALAVFLFAG